MKQSLQVAICLLALVLSANAQTFANFQTLHNFGKPGTASSPYSGVTFNSLGNLYGTTLYDGGYCCTGYGTVYKLTDHVVTILHRFKGPDGAFPVGQLVADATGNLYGTTQVGGNGKYCPSMPIGGCGTVFKFSRGIETVLYKFRNGTDGKWPTQALTLDSTGNLYGSSSSAIFEIQNGKFRVLALQPVVSNLVLDGQGNLYGVNASNNLFEVSIATGKVTILYTFQGLAVGDGSAPMGNIIIDASGNIYGTTEFGGDPGCPLNGVDLGCGTLYEWSQGTETVLYRFQPEPAARNPQFGVIQDTGGNFYGVTTTMPEDASMIYEVTNQDVGITLDIIPEGGNPRGTLTIGSDGNLYGTTSIWGETIYDGGTAYCYFLKTRGCI
jgi:hypothetical protein